MLNKTKFILLGTTSNLRKHFKDSKQAEHQAEWKRIFEEESKTDKTNSTPIKRLLADHRNCQSESKVNKIGVFSSPKYSRNSDHQNIRY